MNWAGPAHVIALVTKWLSAWYYIRRASRPDWWLSDETQGTKVSLILMWRRANLSPVSRDPGTAILGSQLTGLALLSCNRKVANWHPPGPAQLRQSGPKMRVSRTIACAILRNGPFEIWKWVGMWGIWKQWSTSAKNAKYWGSQTSFWREHAPKNTLNLKNWALLGDKTTVSASPKILQLDHWIEMFSLKYCLSGLIKWI